MNEDAMINPILIDPETGEMSEEALKALGPMLLLAFETKFISTAMINEGQFQRIVDAYKANLPTDPDLSARVTLAIADLMMFCSGKLNELFNQVREDLKDG